MIFATCDPITADQYVALVNRSIIEVREAYINQLEPDHPDWTAYREAREREHLQYAAEPVFIEYARVKAEIMDPVDAGGGEVTDDMLRRVFEVMRDLRTLTKAADERGIAYPEAVEKFDHIKGWLDVPTPAQ